MSINTPEVQNKLQLCLVVINHGVDDGVEIIKLIFSPAWQ